MLVAVDANLRGGYPSARVFCTCTGARNDGHRRRVLFLQRAVVACAIADGPGAPFVEGILRALRARRRRPHSTFTMCVCQHC